MSTMFVVSVSLGGEVGQDGHGLRFGGRGGVRLLNGSIVDWRSGGVGGLLEGRCLGHLPSQWGVGSDGRGDIRLHFTN